MKLTKRKGFNFFRSYYDVFNELPEKDKLPFIEALLDKQFLGVNPTDLKGMAKFAWISQINSIDSQVKGFEDKTGVKLTPCQGGVDTPTAQVQVEGEVKGKGKDGFSLIYPFDSLEFKNYWMIWKEYKSKEHKFKYKSTTSEQAALKKLSELSNGLEKTAIEIINQSLSNGWKGFFKLDKNDKASKQDELRNFNNQFRTKA